MRLFESRKVPFKKIPKGGKFALQNAENVIYTKGESYGNYGATYYDENGKKMSEGMSGEVKVIQK